jgi:hypothetical protein
MKSCEEENFKRDLLDKFPVNKPRELAKKHPESDFSRFYGMAASLPIGDPERASRFNATSKALTHVRTELELELVRKQWKGETINGRPFCDELSVLSLDDSSTSLSRVTPSVARISNKTPVLETIEEQCPHRNDEDNRFLLRHICEKLNMLEMDMKEKLNMLEKDMKEIKYFLKNSK